MMGLKKVFIHNSVESWEKGAQWHTAYRQQSKIFQMNGNDEKSARASDNATCSTRDGNWSELETKDQAVPTRAEVPGCGSISSDWLWRRAVRTTHTGRWGQRGKRVACSTVSLLPFFILNWERKCVNAWSLNNPNCDSKTNNKWT